MSDPFIAEIRAFGFNFAPYGWMLCDGQILPISQYTALFSLLGTTYGGNGTTNFGLPDLMGRIPMHWGNGAGLSPYFIGEPAGTTTETITAQQMPMHNHALQVADVGTRTGTPSGSTWLGDSNPATAYVGTGTPNTALSQNAIGLTGGSQPHDNMQPYQVLNFCISLSGVYPARS
jgi:microcystin-dependent protein